MIKRKIKHAVVIVNYNGSADTADCIRSIRKCKDAPHIIVVDNASTDESVAELSRAFPEIELIKNPVNNGFSAGNNIGIKRALGKGAKVIYLLNNDTEVDPNLFYRAYRYVEGRPRIAGGKIYYTKGYEFDEDKKGKGNILWYAGGTMDWSMGIGTHVGVDEEDRGQYDTVTETGFISGCFMAVPRRVFSKIGLLDEQFFLYLEDVDFSLKAAASGIELKYNPSLVVYHRNSGSSGVGSPRVDYYMTRNRLILAKRYGAFRLRLALYREALTRNWNNPVRRLAYLDYLKNRVGNRNEAVAKIH